MTPHLEGQALAKTKSNVSGVIVRGTNWSDLAAKKLLWQSLDQPTIKNFKDNKSIILGYRLAQRLNISVGDYISLVSPNGMETVLGTLPVKQNFLIGGFSILVCMNICLLYTSPSPRDRTRSRMPSSA